MQKAEQREKEARDVAVELKEELEAVQVTRGRRRQWEDSREASFAP